MRRLIFTNNVGKNENKYIVGSNIGSQSRFVKSALLRRSSNNSSGECCIFPGPALVPLTYIINVTVSNNNGMHAYLLNGHDRLGVITKDITINSGDTLVFDLNVAGHPFIITDSDNIEINDIAQRQTSVILTWTPSIVGQFIYKCEVHPSSMRGNIFVN